MLTVTLRISLDCIWHVTAKGGGHGAHGLNPYQATLWELSKSEEKFEWWNASCRAKRRFWSDKKKRNRCH